MTLISVMGLRSVMTERDELEADELRGNIKSLRREKQFLIYLGIIALAAGGYFWPASVGGEAKYICAAIYFSAFLVIVQRPQNPAHHHRLNMATSTK